MLKFAATVAISLLLLAACGQSTGINSSACRRAQDESRMATAQLQDATATQARASGGVSSDAANAMVQMSVERLERASAEMRRACELDPVPNPSEDASKPRETEPQTQRQASTEIPLGPNTYFVNVEMTEERSSPGGAVVNRIYRGQRLEVTDRQGAWVRVTELRYDPRWVRVSHLSRERPAPLPQPELAPDLTDARIQGIPEVGDGGNSEADVRALRAAAAQLLASGQCRRIEYGDRSVNHRGVYFLNCGENSNRFFRMRDGEPHFCGRSASSC